MTSSTLPTRNVASQVNDACGLVFTPFGSKSADGFAAMLPRLVRHVDDRESALSSAEQRLREVQGYCMFPGELTRATRDLVSARTDWQFAVQVLRRAVYTWAILAHVTLTPGQPIPCLNGTEFEGASLSDLEV